MWYVILPLAVRIAIPPTVGFMVQIVKNTSLVSVIGMAEVTYIGKQVNAATFQPFITYLVIGAMYFVICYPLSWWSHQLEKKTNVGNR
jgi:polar amino acid transport system permease protein